MSPTSTFFDLVLIVPFFCLAMYATKELAEYPVKYFLELRDIVLLLNSMIASVFDTGATLILSMHRKTMVVFDMETWEHVWIWMIPVFALLALIPCPLRNPSMGEYAAWILIKIGATFFGGYGLYAMYAIEVNKVFVTIVAMGAIYVFADSEHKRLTISDE